MNRTRIALKLSLLLTLLLLPAPMFIDGSSWRLALPDRETLHVLLGPMLLFLFFSLPLWWPWWLAFRKANWPGRQRPLRCFAAVTLGSATALLYCAVTQPSFAWYFLQLLVGWLAYPLSLPLRTAELPPVEDYRGEERIVRWARQTLALLARLLGGAGRKTPR